jgi:hypothetical protein
MQKAHSIIYRHSASILAMILTSTIVISYYVIVTPIAMVTRFLGKKYLDRIDSSRASYWNERPKS